MLTSGEVNTTLPADGAGKTVRHRCQGMLSLSPPMKASRPTGSSTIRFAVDELPPHLLAAGLGLQVVILIIASIALTPIVVLRAAGVDIERASWT
ncbi:MAG TPA: hypothetical protein VFX36_03410, partial [Nitrospira sp.]|nr:hypothetical protein [Nitrospira sp.]